MVSKSKSSSEEKTSTKKLLRKHLMHGKKKQRKGKVRVFVYGTLKRGHYNNGILSRGGAEFIGYDTITGPLSMVDLGTFPGVVRDEAIEGANTVFGEVYALPDTKGRDNTCLEACDWLEGHPNFYLREKFRTDHMDTNVWMYTLPARYLNNDSIPEGIWSPSSDEELAWGDFFEQAS